MFRFILSILFILAIPIILSSLLSCRVAIEGDPHYQGPRPGPGPGPGPADLLRIGGSWVINANNAPGKLEFYWNGYVWTGQIYFDNQRQWEQLTDIIADPHTGKLGFTRPYGNQRFYGILMDDRMQGTFSHGGVGRHPWEAWRD